MKRPSIGQRAIAGLRDFTRDLTAGGLSSYRATTVKRKKKGDNPWPRRLKRLRDELGLTQEEAAAHVECACVHPDARECLIRRCDQHRMFCDQPAHLDDACECICHDDEDDKDAR